MRKLTPVTLPPGRLRLGTRPGPTGSPPIEDIGIVDVAAFAACAGATTQCGNHCDPTAHQVGREGRQPVELASQAEPFQHEGRDPPLGESRVLHPNCGGLGLPARPLGRPSLGAWGVIRGDVTGTAIQRRRIEQAAISTAYGLPASRLPALPCCPYVEWPDAAVPKPSRAAGRSALRDRVAQRR